ncbi:hypothetical protein P775_03655 [Puniceibacterium antarcticum]|uniref:Uncharacterized protein n=1 Tax=Puniceibacterium antarcticum TaxID=1206336 RepID=A0A2G8RJ00_9RHOB|nr:hypothetical protein P775_03655 [Puniceibacterium antarcticum]
MIYKYLQNPLHRRNEAIQSTRAWIGAMIGNSTTSIGKMTSDARDACIWDCQDGAHQRVERIRVSYRETVSTKTGRIKAKMYIRSLSKVAVNLADFLYLIKRSSHLPYPPIGFGGIADLSL